MPKKAVVFVFDPVWKSVLTVFVSRTCSKYSMQVHCPVTGPAQESKAVPFSETNMCLLKPERRGSFTGQMGRESYLGFEKTGLLFFIDHGIFYSESGADDGFVAHWQKTASVADRRFVSPIPNAENRRFPETARSEVAVVGSWN